MPSPPPDPATAPLTPAVTQAGTQQDHYTIEIQPSRPPRPANSSPAPRLTNARNDVPLYGSLNMTDAVFFVKATVTQLKAIVASGPRHLKAHLPSSPTKDMLLETVPNIRTEETVQSRLSHRTPEESLRELLNLSPEELHILASSDASNLLIRSALQADENL